MALSIGIVGLPNVGKSTTFNALVKEQKAEAANYPFCTIEPNRAVVTVPDARVDKLGELVRPQRVVPATLEFVDIAGLVKGASRGEGLGNKFLANIRQCAVIVHVVRCFEDENVMHVTATPQPLDDIETITTELVLADLEQFERKVERLAKLAKGDKAAAPVLEEATRVRDHLAEGLPVSAYTPMHGDAFRELLRDLTPLTAKPVIYAANVDETGLTASNAYVEKVRQYAAQHGAEIVVLCAKVEEEMAGMDEFERHEMLKLMGAAESGLDQVIRKGFDALGLISFFTVGPKEVHAWNVRRGTTAYQAAGVIHSDFQRGFIRAEVIAYDDFARCGSENAAKAAGRMSVEGKDYVVQDGDVIYFRFNV